jgi:SPX domain protein involved in polyphosphate accumulation
MIETSNNKLASTTSERIERKYALPDFMLDDAVNAIERILPIYRYNGSSNWTSIRTTYLDTLGFQCYQDYLQKLPVRKKIRIRQYGLNGRFDGIYWVEIKVKNHRLSMKQRFRCGAGELTLFMQENKVRERIIQQNKFDVAHTYDMIYAMIHNQGLGPAVQVQYERLAFQPEGRSDLRVTLDRDIQFQCPQQIHRAALQGLVLEVKHNGGIPDWMSELRAILGLRRVKRFSKFARSIRRLTELRGLEESLWAG